MFYRYSSSLHYHMVFKKSMYQFGVQVEFPSITVENGCVALNFFSKHDTFFQDSAMNSTFKRTAFNFEIDFL